MSGARFKRISRQTVVVEHVGCMNSPGNAAQRLKQHPSTSGVGHLVKSTRKEEWSLISG